ncbi:MAG: cell division regulator GpsB [Bacilli bacterium]|nr:cell division regulator GpsB [Bacilli bacterium]MDD4298219.1 cell division regulator GpsB [Bacilli bacterium]
MLYDRITLSPKEILEKDFPLDTRGYRPQEVDKYLDIIIKDYSNFISLLKQKESEQKELIEENLQLKHENRILKENVEIVKNTDVKITNVDLLRRLSQLEKTVYGEEE